MSDNKNQRPDILPFRTAFWDGMIFNNLTLVEFVGLTPIVAGGSTVIGGFILSAATLFVLVLVTLFAATVGERLPTRLTPALYTILSAALLIPLALLGYWLFPGEMLAIGIVFPLVAVNGITLDRVRNFKGYGRMATLGDALGKALGFALVMFVVSSLREILGYGTFCNLTVPFFTDHCSPVIAGVPGGLFFLAVLAQRIKSASFRYTKKKQRKEETDCAVAQ